MNTPAALAALALALAPVATSTDQDTPLAIEVLTGITVAEDHPMTNYDRDRFAPSGWVDATGNGCTTREDILARDLDNGTLQTIGCTVEYGQTIGAYSGELIEHIQGSSEVDIEHIVAVGQAWRNGAHEWDETTRHEFYQDQENLIAVSSSENQSKGAKDATEYMPPNQGAYCEYAGATVYIKDKYDLSMNPAEHTFTQDLLNDPECTGTSAAPARAIYTSDWQAQPSTPNTSGHLAQIAGDTPPLALIGIATTVLICLITLTASPKIRKALTRSLKRNAKRSARSGVRSLMRK